MTTPPPKRGGGGSDEKKEKEKEKEKEKGVYQTLDIDMDELDISTRGRFGKKTLAFEYTFQNTGEKIQWGDKCERVDTVLGKERAKDETRAVGLIKAVLQCCNHLLRHSIFSKGWVHMRMVEAEVAMRGLSWFGSTLKRSYLGRSFDKDLWQLWLGLGMTFLSNEDFALEDMEEGREQVIIKKRLFFLFFF